MIQKAHTFMEQKRWKEASNLWQEIREEKPNEATAFIQGGIALRKLKKYDEALKIFDKSIKLHPNAISNKIQKAHTFMEQKRWEEASNLWQEIREEKPNEATAFIQGGIVLRNLKKYDEATILLLNISHNKNSITRIRSILFDLLPLISSEILYNKVWLFIVSEKFDYKEPTIISLKMTPLFYSDKTLYEKYDNIIKTYYAKLDYYNKLFLGYEEKPDIKFITSLFETGNLNLIKRIISSSPLHKYNFNVVKKQKLYNKSNDTIITKAYSQIMENFNIDISNKNFNRLKIAICVSGQLRGYKKAFKSWNKFSFSDHHVDYYCSVWDNIGSKQIHKAHLYRLFDSKFSEVFLEYSRQYTNEELETKLSSLYDHYSREQLVTENEIKKFYNATKVSIEKEEDFDDKSNMYKMHYMIENCFNLIDDPDKYDLIVRIRPDKEIKKFDLDWNIINSFLDNSILMSDMKPLIHQGVGPVIGDQFAIARPDTMRKYSESFSKVQNREQPYNIDQYKRFRGHITLFLSMLQNNKIVIGFNMFSSKVKFGRPCNSERINNKTLQKLISEDLKDEPEALQKFIEAIKLDEKEKQ